MFYLSHYSHREQIRVVNTLISKLVLSHNNQECSVIITGHIITYSKELVVGVLKECLFRRTEDSEIQYCSKDSHAPWFAGSIPPSSLH